MKRFRMQALVSAVGLCAVVGVTSASASARTQTLQFTSVSQRTVITPAVTKTSPPQVGGRIVFQDVMYNDAAQLGKANGARIGRAEGVCTLISATRPEAQCLITAHLPNGVLVVVGEGDPGGKLARYAITGGTGAYESARGTVVSRTVNDTKTLITVTLSL